ncbi:hypothetical protein CH63R_09433 [Colletotrichum higginsianum IMI 349063]|uniref:Uncharacterized protein n=1 Tax=Colletotrichum higginsianum (strain IMI 349063) TaxID=759273 RepID=A0A1B7Y776_COLHI|nr:hypothetical protein CH63R_09433 [Colletotrichum higginsianum IMI 349063]OBR07912.1 hypothetical protein CH63R_09433 [Colletotrichum higginsianum IMI 349063]
MEMPSVAALAGARLLGDVEEANLEEVLHLRVVTNLQSPQILNALRAAVNPNASSSKTKHIKAYPIPGLDIIVARNFRATNSAPLAVTGRRLPLIYALISTLVSPPHNKTVLVLDTEHRFDATRLVCSPESIRHVYVHRPACDAIHGPRGDGGAGMGPDQVRQLVTAAEDWMLYGDHESSGREWWGTIVIGALGAGDVTAAWKGWLRIDRDNIPGFSLGCSAKEAMTDRQRRQEAVDAAPWAASSQWGSFTFPDSLQLQLRPPGRLDARSQLAGCASSEGAEAGKKRQEEDARGRGGEAGGDGDGEECVHNRHG